MRLAGSLVILVATLSLAGCAVTPRRPPIVFEAQEDDGCIPFYVMGEPYGTSTSTCGQVTFHLDVFSIAGSGYMGAFVHYSHSDEESFLLEPLADLTLKITEVDGTETVLSPRAPFEIERSIEASKNAALFAEVLLAGIGAAMVRPTTVTGPSGTFEIDDTALKRAIIAGETADAMVATQLSADWLAESVQSHVLKRHTMFPGREVAGMVYFPAKFAAKSDYRTSRVDRGEIEGRVFELSVRTPCATETIRFLPADGE